MRFKKGFSARLIGARFYGFALVAGAASLLAGCEDSMNGSPMRAYYPIPPETVSLIREKGSTQNASMLIRTYKKEAELEVWKMKADGRYTHLKTFPMCRWSGQLGPKVREGDRQVPEGFYAITPGQMNPNSNYYLSFNVGYPNAYDRVQGHTGGSIMVHGVCSSAGCFSMTDQQIAEIYALARESFNGGQHAIQMQSFPFHMTAENMAKYRADPNIAFWKELKKGADEFEVTQDEVAVGVCDRHYVFNATPANGGRLEPGEPCPALKRDDAVEARVEAKETGDQARVAELVSQGIPAIHTVYADGGQHPSFANAGLDVSRPEALAEGPRDITLDDGKSKKKVPPAVQIAAVKAEMQKQAAAAAKAEDAKWQAAQAGAKGEPNKTENKTAQAKAESGKSEPVKAADAKAADPKSQNAKTDGKPQTVAAYAATPGAPAAPKSDPSVINRMMWWKQQPQDQAASDQGQAQH